MACYFVEAAPHGDAACTLMNLCLPAWEHMGREAEDRMERHKLEGQRQASSRSRWQRDRESWRGRGWVGGWGVCMIEWKGDPLVAHVLRLLLSSTTCQRLSQSPQTGKIEVFSPAVLLSGDNHPLLSVPHRQSGLQWTRQASTWGTHKGFH